MIPPKKYGSGRIRIYFYWILIFQFSSFTPQGISQGNKFSYEENRIKKFAEDKIFLLQDRNKLLWGNDTKGRLFTDDGIEFKYFDQDYLGDTRGFCGFPIKQGECPFMDSNNNIWFASFSCLLSTYDPHNQRFIDFSSKLSSLSDDNPRYVTSDFKESSKL